ncbi:HNH endonuclease signature motif containing protein [Mycobacterium sp. 5-140-3-2]|uniref:HNH endonuclease signature motif containing protein n=1 Tax=unclassified Mycobacterium TaxID=2642494 RepID=UPI002D7899BA|nr:MULTISPECIES: HNH endonuclease signature motif containing protein [unclassified Mycobacterium]WRU81774.1 HNH endonuclease signature motif containing protein [Mycobacterium sp. 5-140-3-2]WSE42072.1 HNH endonuclease signature motif containing protein [Mycobacterium sp. 5-140-3-1]
MSSTGLPDVDAVFDALDAEVDRACALVLDALTVQQQLAVLERCERLRRRIPVIEHPLLNSLARQVPSQDLGGGLSHALTERTLISRHEASRRIQEARDLGPRHGLTGEPLPPALAATAAAQRAGDLGAGQVAVIRKFYHQLPGWVSAAAREFAEAQLAGFGTQFGPEHLKELARGLTDALNPDGTFTDEDRARSRGVTLGNQQADGMSELRGLITPELRATFEAVEAKLGAPGMCNPLDDIPCVEGTPSQAAIDGDTRSKAQRGHDALLAGLRGLLASGELGQHNGLPASIIVTTTLAELEAAAGRALTGGGTILPMSEVIRLGRHAHHYLAIFDKGKALALYHTKRLASPGQRIVLYAKDRGCTAPGCTVSGYYCEVHHTIDYSKCHSTDINQLTFACGPHHRMLDPGGWTTRKNTRGDTEWKPPPHLERGQPRTNTYHHPEKLLHHESNDDEADNPGAA